MVRFSLVAKGSEHYGTYICDQSLEKQPRQQLQLRIRYQKHYGQQSYASEANPLRHTPDPLVFCHGLSHLCTPMHKK